MKQFLFILLLFCKFSLFAQNIPFSPLNFCVVDTTFFTCNNFTSCEQTMDVHRDKLGNYHAAGYTIHERPPYQYTSGMWYRKYNSDKELQYERKFSNQFNWATSSDCLNSVTTDDSLNYYYSGQYHCNDCVNYSDYFRFDSIEFFGLNDWQDHDHNFAFIAKHDSLNNLKFLLLLANPNPLDLQTGFNDMVYLNNKIYALLNDGEPGYSQLFSYNFQNQTWDTLSLYLGGIGISLLEISTNGELLNIIPISEFTDQVVQGGGGCSGAFGYSHSRMGGLSLDRQNRILVHYAKSITSDFRQSSFATYDVNNGWLNNITMEKAKAWLKEETSKTIESDAHGNKYLIENQYSNYYQQIPWCVIDQDTINNLGAALIKLGANSNFLWKKYFINAEIVDIKLSPNEKHLGVTINTTNENITNYPLNNGRKFWFGSDPSHFDTVSYTSANSGSFPNHTIFMQFSNTGNFEKMFLIGSDKSCGQYINLDDDGYFNANVYIYHTDSAFFVFNGDTIYNTPTSPGQTNTAYLNFLSFKIEGENGQCSGPAFPGGLADTLFIHLPHTEICGNSSVFIPWIATDTIDNINIGYYLNTDTTKNYFAQNLDAQSYGYTCTLPPTLSNADSLIFFIESTDQVYNHQTSYFKFYINRNIINWSDTTVCAGTPIQIIPVDTFNLTWSPAGFFVNPSLDSMQVISLQNSAQLLLTETTPFNSCINYDTVNVNVIPLAVADFNATLLPASLSLVNTVNSNDSIKWLINNLPPYYNIDSIIIPFTAPVYNVCLIAKNNCNIDTLCTSINVAYSTNDTIHFCYGDSVFLQNAWRKNPGLYHDTLQSVIGIDSIIHTELIIHYLSYNFSVFYSGFYMGGSNIGIQWYNCDLQTIVANQTTNYFNPTVNGNYACIVTQGYCTDTTACYGIFTVGLEQQNINGIKFFPNPNKGVFMIDLPEKSVVIGYNMLGDEVYASNLAKGLNEISFEQYDAGVYIFKVIQNDEYVYFKIFKQ